MKNKKWIAGTLSVLAVGGMLYLGQPAVSYAADSLPVQNTWQRGAGMAANMQNSMLDFISNLLGMDKTEVIQERQAGKSMVNIAETEGLTEEALVSKIIEERSNINDQRVQAGTMTEEQAQVCEENMETRIKSNLNRTTVGPNPNRQNGAVAAQGKGMRGGQMGGQMGARWQQAQ